MSDHRAYHAARLVAFGMRLKLRPAHDSEYENLVRRWYAEPPFRDTVVSIAEAFGMRVLAVDSVQGLVLGAQSGSLFAQSLTSIRNQFKREDANALALVMIGMVAVLYPTAADLEFEEESLRQANLSDMRETIVAICRRLEMAAKAGDAETAELGPGWRHLLSIPELNDAKGVKAGKDRARPSSVEGLIRMVLNLWEENALVQIRETDAQVRVTAMPRLRLQIAEHAAMPLLILARAVQEESAIA
jgi:hypothetical protein